MKAKFPLQKAIQISLLVSRLALGADIPPLAKTERDAMFAMPHYTQCTDPIQNPSCRGPDGQDICTDMRIPFDKEKHLWGRDTDKVLFLAKPERYDMKGISQHKILLNLKPPYVAKEIAYREPDANTGARKIEDPVPGTVSTYEIGNISDAGCKWATIWVHGADPGKGDLGIVNNNFGGAFNRMKHLAADNHGLYYSPSVYDFSNDDGIVALIKYIHSETCPRGKIIMNCGSAGAGICWRIANDKRVSDEISGMVVIGGGVPDSLKDLEIVKRKVPILLTHGDKGDDGAEDSHQAVLDLHKSMPDYPVRFVLFENGVHMTPLRMLDWKETMNCMLAQAPDPVPPNGKQDKQNVEGRSAREMR
ncbi:MAG: hypothetical protein C5B49_01120 [Bdellovibrio sp.]|nr:MAG: hypothetical protein C5B49_01120 [Bdellovibrio sp.]